MSRKIFATLLLVLGLYAYSNPLWAGPADDYYREANSFFKQKDYQRAFDAYQGAIPYDVDPYRAYLGMGNCEYFLNNREKAVEYLQKSDDIHQEPKVEAFIQKIKSTIPKPKTPIFIKAEILIRNKQYGAAVPFLKEVEHYESSNLKAFYDLGYCYYALGDRPEATLNFAYYENKTHDTAVTTLVSKMESRLTLDDQDWLDSQIQLGPPFSKPFRYSGVGIRFEPSLQITSLKDFNNFNADLQKEASQYTSSVDSSFVLTTGVPFGGLAIDLNPYLQVSDDLEVGLTFGTLFLGQMTASYTTSENGGFEDDAAISYNVIDIGASLRAELIRLYRNKIKLFVELNPAYYMTNISTANGEITQPTVNPGFYDFPQVTGNFSSSGIGGRVKLGVDFKPAPSSVISGFLGYQIAQIQGFSGSGLVPNSSVSVSGQLETQQGPNGTRIIFVQNGITPSGNKPSSLTLDLSGIIIGADMTILL